MLLNLEGSRILGFSKCFALWNILDLSHSLLFVRNDVRFEFVEQYLHDPAVMTEAELVSQITETLHHLGSAVRLFSQSRPKLHEPKIVNRLGRHLKFIDNDRCILHFLVTMCIPLRLVSIQQVPLQENFHLLLQLREGQRSATIDPA